MECNPMNVFYLYVVSSVFQVYLHWFWYHLYKLWEREREKNKEHFRFVNKMNDCDGDVSPESTEKAAKTFFS